MARHGIERFDLTWTLHGLPFLTGRGELVAAVTESIRAETGLEVELSTGGGTSDGRFIAPTGAQVIELGPRNATIHKIDACVAGGDLPRLSALYRRVLERLLTTR
jgi:succinyl-diaminopimelate desuccinylase